MTDYRKLLISRNVEPLTETMASILVSETSATGETSIEGIRNWGEEGRTVLTKEGACAEELIKRKFPMAA